MLEEAPHGGNDVIAAEDPTTVSDGAGTIQFIDVATGTPLQWCGRRVEDLDAEIARLKAEVALLRGLLRECEWAAGSQWDGYGCSICGEDRPNHRHGCRLAAALEKDHG